MLDAQKDSQKRMHFYVFSIISVSVQEYSHHLAEITIYNYFY